MTERVVNYILAIGFGVAGGVIIKKLNDIQAEIEYLEREEGIYCNRKTTEKIRAERFGI